LSRLASRSSISLVPASLRPTASVVICTYTDRRWNVLLEVIEGVLAQDPPPDQLVLVVDHNERLRQRLQDAFSNLLVVSSTEKQGLSGARNTGIARATGDVIVFLDDDAVPAEGWLEALVAAYGDEKVIGTGGIATPVWEDRRPSWMPEEFLWTVGCSYRGLPSDRRPVRNPIGANMAFRRCVFDAIGSFRDGIGRVGKTPLGCEETEFSIRALHALPGSLIVHIPEAIVAHSVPSDRARWRYFSSRCWAEGLSKALVTESVGNEQGLLSERTYTTRTLPRGVLAGFVDAISGDVSGVLRAGTIVAGLVITTAGFVRGLLTRRGTVPRRVLKKSRTPE
jgi:glucosyl-dolichyl phosphate glucuronosyltransferase